MFEAPSGAFFEVNRPQSATESVSFRISPFGKSARSQARHCGRLRMKTAGAKAFQARTRNAKISDATP